MHFYSIIYLQKIETLQTVQNAALRIVTGALRTSPTNNLHIDANIPTLCRRRKFQLLRFYSRANSHPTRPTFHILNQPTSNRRLTTLQKRYPRIHLRVKETLTLFNIPHLNIMPSPPLTPYWLDTTPDTHFLFTHNKNTVTAAETQTLFHEYKSQHNTYTFIYTDGSRSEGRTGGGYTLDNNITNKKFRLSDINSVFTAEITAILLAITYIKEEKIKQAVICTDSSSSILSISSTQINTNPIVYKIRQLINDLYKENMKIKFLWIPGHAGIRGNNEADRLAKSSLALPPENNIPSPRTDIFNHIHQQFTKLRQREWDADPHFHLHPIKPIISHFTTNHQDCREKEIILARLRIGQTKLTHSFIIERTPPTTCQHCPDFPRYTIKHFLIDCPKHNNERRQIINFTQQNRIPFNLPNLLGDEYPELLQLVFDFLLKTRLVNNI